MDVIFRPVYRADDVEQAALRPAQVPARQMACPSSEHLALMAA
jgi:hypothetical protein